MEIDTPMNQNNNNFESIQQTVLSSSCSKESLLVPHKIQFRSLAKANAVEDSKYATPKIEKKVRLNDSVRIYFTCYDIKNDSMNMTLLCSDVNEETTSSDNKEELAWNNLIGDAIQTSKNSLSHEEKLMRERMRLSSSGVSTYELNKSTGRLIYPLAGKIYTFIDDGMATGYPPHAVYLKTTDACIQPTSCPHNPEFIAYVCGKDLWLAHVSSEENVCLASPERREECGVGVPTYIIQEEFDRYIGFWWQPRSTSGVYRILYEEYDESGVEVVNVMMHLSVGMKSEKCYYPKPGKKNAVSDLKIVQFEVDVNGSVRNVQVLKLQRPLYKLFPNSEYLVRAGWTKDGKYVWCQLLDRLQTNLYLYLLPLENFSSQDDKGFTAISLLWETESNYWVAVNDYLCFLEVSGQQASSPGETNCVEFMWVSERTHYRHIYHMKRSWQTSKLNFSPENCSIIAANEVLTRQLTAGNWEVLGDNIWVNEKRQIVYYLGLKEHPLKKNLYAVSYSELNAGSTVRLTENDSYSYDCSMDADLDIAVVSYSNLETHAGHMVARLQFTDTPQDWVSLKEVACLRQPMCHKDVLSNPLSIIKPPILLQFDIPSQFADRPEDNSQSTLYGLLFVPSAPPQDRRGYPCVHYIYAGPCIQLVTAAYNQHMYFKAQLYCHYGYAFLICDSRGSHNRGLKFAGHVKYRMGQIELHEQTEFLKKAAEETGLIDLNRVAIQGSSYGGYMTLMAMCCFTHVYRIGYASAPVVDWTLYDTGYTERYMGLPDVDSRAYSLGHVLRYAHGFPRETNRLVISHGGQDENVHIYHTSQLLEKLASYGRPYIFQFYPSSRHRINQSHHWDSTVLTHLEENLKPYRVEEAL